MSTNQPIDPSTDMSMRRSLCTFWLAGLCFGVDVLDVQEVIRHQEVTPVPLAPQVVVGLMNLRGQIITSCDLRIRLDLGERSPGQVPMNVVVRTGEGPVSLLVDEIGDVIQVADDTFETPPSTVTGVARDLIVGAYKLDGKLLLELDIVRLINGLAVTVDA
ncbi:MAG: chemotaxis protein CheW [Acidimicrobiales bacterium]